MDATVKRQLLLTAREIVADIVMEDANLQEIIHRVTLSELGYNDNEIPRIIVGGDRTDEVDNLREYGKATIRDDDPKYEQYWNVSSALWCYVVTQTGVRLGTPLDWQTFEYVEAQDEDEVFK